MSKKGIGISKFEVLLMLPGVRKQLKKSVDKSGTLDVGDGMRTIGYVSRRLGKAARKPYKDLLESQAKAFDALGNVIDIGGQDMKFELGITVGEITAMLPELLAAAWMHYSDDKKLTLDEGIDLVGTIMDSMAEAADEENVADFFFAQAAALRALAPFFEEEEEEPAPEPPVE